MINLFVDKSYSLLNEITIDTFQKLFSCIQFKHVVSKLLIFTKSLEYVGLLDNTFAHVLAISNTTNELNIKSKEIFWVLLVTVWVPLGPNWLPVNLQNKFVTQQNTSLMKPTVLIATLHSSKTLLHFYHHFPLLHSPQTLW